MTAVQLIRQALESGRWMLTAMLDGLDGRALVFRPAGGRGNHALWLLGHVAVSESHIAAWAGAKIKAAPPGDPAKVAMGSTPVADPSAYPSKQELLDYAAAVRAAALKYLDKVKAADLDRPAVKAPDFIKTRGDAWRLMAVHEMMHVGQLTVVRKELALPAVLA